MDKTLFRSPCAGVIKDIKLGARRFPVEISIEADAQGESETFQSYTTEEILNLDRNTLCEHLLHAGVWPLIKQRPFNKIADPYTMPKAVFVNAANSALFRQTSA